MVDIEVTDKLGKKFQKGLAPGGVAVEIEVTDKLGKKFQKGCGTCEDTLK